MGGRVTRPAPSWRRVLAREPREDARPVLPEPVRPENAEEPVPAVRPERAEEPVPAVPWLPVAATAPEIAALFPESVLASTDCPAGGRPQSSQNPSTILPVQPGRWQRTSIHFPHFRVAPQGWPLCAATQVLRCTKRPVSTRTPE